MEQIWIDWCQKQFTEVSQALDIQGYTPELIECLNLVSGEFAQHFNRFLEETSRIMDAMTQNPGGFHHYETFANARRTLLTYTSENRERFVDQSRVEVA